MSLGTFGYESNVLRDQPEGIKAIGVLLHSHMLGTGVSTRHFRGGTELPPLASDMAYDYNYQEGRYIPEEISILPGGLSMKDEMCMSYILYYPKVPLTFCTSSPPITDVSRVSGVSRFYWGQEVVIFPKSSQGLTLLQAMENVDWAAPGVLEQYTRDIRGSEIFARCLYCNSNGTYKTDRKSVTLTPVTQKYRETNTCSGCEAKPLISTMLFVVVHVVLNYINVFV